MAIRSSGDDLIAAIYDVIIEPSRWDEVVNRIVEATKSMSGGLPSLWKSRRSMIHGCAGRLREPAGELERKGIPIPHPPLISPNYAIENAYLGISRLATMQPRCQWLW
jgi:hypothetical protein